ncbi:ATP-binding protein [Actinacidiphila sp. DG2A-62]|uniref:ATP-binding protein n=1 Tax=Actinacidiphila sp. DG2A-62 TaxID=3108821 RepID=UPI002DBAB6D9|nr:ATP-binding protein [Actinacidiphila sp. DG2A-62]MEC3997770.1 ATP-binding protein [Actinacidiphila sp. DG2A-62]
MQATAEDVATSTEIVTRRWPQRPAAVRGARRLLRSTLLGWDRAQLVDDAELVLSELLANAVVHARVAGATVETRFAALGPAAVRVEVCDEDSRHVPRLRAAMPGDQRGRGLQIVDELTEQRWGYEWRTDDAGAATGKVVWAHLGRLRPL